MRRVGDRIGMCGWLCLALVLGAVRMASAQTPPLNPLALQSTPPPAVTYSVSGLQVTVGPGLARARALLTEIGRLAHVEIRNLAHVPDVEIYVDFAGEPLASVIDRILGYAKADYIWLAGTDASGFVVAVFDRPAVDPRQPVLNSASASAGGNADGRIESSTLPVPPAVELPAIDTASASASGSAGVALDVRPEVIQLERAPAWQPVEMIPQAVEIPVGMTPQAFPIAAPPPVNARPKPPPPPKRQ